MVTPLLVCKSLAGGTRNAWAEATAKSSVGFFAESSVGSIPSLWTRILNPQSPELYRQEALIPKGNQWEIWYSLGHSCSIPWFPNLCTYWGHSPAWWLLNAFLPRGIAEWTYLQIPSHSDGLGVRTLRCLFSYHGRGERGHNSIQNPGKMVKKII